jgi:2-oxoglutarate dehydrogenase complex dehydrogenase (E1) component-like enzyme
MIISDRTAAAMDPGTDRAAARHRWFFHGKQQKRLLQKLTEAEQLERYCTQVRRPRSASRWSCGESLIPSIDDLIQRAGANGVQEIVIGMAHRGRLNVLINVLGKMPKDLFLEFEGKHAAELSSGDVKYHNGFSSDITTPGGPVHLSLAFNPSHLEIVNPVVEGSVRARQRRRDDKTGDQVLPILVHGDAAFAGQGVVMETLNLSGTRGYGTGGTVHLIVNNQIGFTTSDPRDARSTIYCTDVAKMVEAPIFHVNGDDPEAVLFVTQLALDFRQKFHKDVVIDIVCFRKLGPQRAGRAVRHAAADVQEDRAAPRHAEAVRRQAGRAERRRPGRARGADQALPRHARRRAADRQPGALQLQEQVRRRLGAVPQCEVDRRGGYQRSAR